MSARYQILELTERPHVVEVAGPGILETIYGFPCGMKAEQLERILELAYAAGVASTVKAPEPTTGGGL